MLAKLHVNVSLYLLNSLHQNQDDGENMVISLDLCIWVKFNTSIVKTLEEFSSFICSTIDGHHEYFLKPISS